MSMSLMVQYVVVAMAVLFAAGITLRKLAPKLVSRWQAAWSIRLSQPGHAGWQRALGRWLQPQAASGHCGDGCDTCGSCGPKPPANANARPGVQPLEFRTRTK